MVKWQAISIKKKVYFCFFVLMGTSVAAFAYTYMALDLLKNSTRWNMHTMTVISELKEMETLLALQQSSIRGYLTTANPSYLESFEEYKASFNTIHARTTTLTEDNAVQQQTLTELARLRDEWEATAVSGMIRAAQESEVNTVKAGLVDAGREMFRGIRAKLDEGVQLEGSLLTERQSTADAAASNAAIATIGAGTLLFLIVVFSIAVISRSLIRPLLLLQNVLQDIREGQLQVDVPYRQREDEMGALGRSIEELRLSAVAKHQFELQASDERKKREAERETLQMAAEDAANARVRNAVEGFATALGRLAEGDVAFQIDTPFAPEFDSLRQDLNHTITQLGEALGAVGGAVVSIQSGASEINSGTSDLARRTEQQAASLEETASALEEVTVNVKNSALRVAEARAVAQDANASAKQSGEIVKDAEAAMQRIASSSQQIASIIAVIDEIAFQTNLLTLNAGVEAARAGDAGKGFAVVAQEVRELAQRSASAAKEIEQLISSSSQEVRAGVDLVRQTSTALASIERYVLSINQHMEAITSAANEQAIGISEINSTVGHLDQLTQQNAAMVQQSNSATEGLAHEASALRQITAKFKLPMRDPASSLREMSKLMAKPTAPSFSMASAAPMERRVANGSTGGAAGGSGWQEF